MTHSDTPLTSAELKGPLRDCIETMRKSLELALHSAISTRDTTGTCLYGSILVKTAVEQWFKDFTAVIRGGSPDESPGLGCFDGRLWRGHYWVELQRDGVPVWVVDITADQFGFPPVRILPFPDAMQNYNAGDQRHVDEAVEDEMSRIG